ncbi:hypothetical protein [Mycobacterium gastri]|uniref:Uncharacterized protein n=1 Tax=Mycobacterium gastri TaxID=1777 RepID=A0A1X1W2D6_MYCGS|nr:hypothetical protein [Mycobacterium gastri]ETW26565.1 hypothetical protein MGAST_12785 [Mycobacterium gastri 'Wayne']ORV80773.1 hypothetical protein AWC07_00025 [Mycobacterium gastri]
MQIYVVLSDRRRRWSGIHVKAVGTCPRSSIATHTFGIEYLLRGRHDLGYRGTRCVRRVNIAPSLNRLYFHQLLWDWLFGCKYVIDFSIACICDICQPASQIVDRVSACIESFRFYLIFFRFIEFGLFTPKIPRNQILSGFSFIL